jgi:hypothetical protein
MVIHGDRLGTADDGEEDDDAATERTKQEIKGVRDF